MKRLLIISHTSHYHRDDGEIVGWGPTITELDYLAQLFGEVVHIAPLHPTPAPASALPYQSHHIRLRPLPPAGGRQLRHKLGILRQIPHYLRVIQQEVQHADALHVRFPAHISLIAMMHLALNSQPTCRWFKYAGNWRPNGQEPWSYVWQRWLLRRGIGRGAVTVNGRWPEQPEHVYTFYNPSLTSQDMKNGRKAAALKSLQPPYYFLFVGALNSQKGVGRVLQIATQLHKDGVPFELHFIGDGPDRPQFESWAQIHNLASNVTFHSWLPKPMLAAYYAQAHFLLLPSVSEGWPKVLSEAMAYGVVPLAGAVSCIPQILSATNAGVALPINDLDAFVQAIVDFIAHPTQWHKTSLAALAAAPRFSYAHYVDAVRELFQEAWEIPLALEAIHE